MKCIYCKKNKNENQFNIEHVIPKAFISFPENNKTLKNCVCKDCNEYFGKYHDLILLRDSILGILFRVITGIISPDKFKITINHRKQRIEPFCIHPDYGKLLVDLNFLEGHVISDQVGVMNSTKGRRIPFRLAQLPHRNSLEAMGLKPTKGYILFFVNPNNYSSLYTQTRQVANL